MKYLSAYSDDLKSSIQKLIDEGRLAEVLLSRYPNAHSFNNDKLLREYVLLLKGRYLKKSNPLTEIKYNASIHVINHALGMHRIHTRAHGGKLKTKSDIQISSIFKKMPEPFLKMIVVHELAHLKEKEHNKAFYQLCEHMLPDYHQLEFDTRVYLTQLDIGGSLY
jgi:hypothetical protein